MNKMDEVKEEVKESTKKMTTGVSRLLVETSLPEVPEWTRKIHYLHDHNYRVNFWKFATGKIMKSHYVIVHPDKSLTIHDD